MTSGAASVVAVLLLAPGMAQPRGDAVQPADTSVGADSGASFRGFPVRSRLALSAVGVGGIALLCYFDRRDRSTASEPDD